MTILKAIKTMMNIANDAVNRLVKFIFVFDALNTSQVIKVATGNKAKI